MVKHVSPPLWTCGEGERDERRKGWGKYFPFTSAESLQSEGIFYTALLQDSPPCCFLMMPPPPRRREEALDYDGHRRLTSERSRTRQPFHVIQRHGDRFPPLPSLVFSLFRLASPAKLARKHAGSGKPASKRHLFGWESFCAG